MEEDLVAARGRDPSLRQEDFHRWLTLARLTAASCGATELGEAHWARARELEHSVAERVRVC